MNDCLEFQFCLSIFANWAFLVPNFAFQTKFFGTCRKIFEQFLGNPNF